MRILMTADGNAGQVLGTGWSTAEPEFIWAVGPRSELTIPTEALSHSCLLRLHCWPHRQAGLLDRQRVEVSVNGHAVGHFELRAKRLLVALVPHAAVAGATHLHIVLHHPDNARPMDFPGVTNGDDRALAVAYTGIEVEELDGDAEQLAGGIRRALAGEPLATASDSLDGLVTADIVAAASVALSRLQSVGDDCELGFVQRRYLLEPLGVFRFASIDINNVTAGITCGLVDFAEPEHLAIRVHQDDPAHDYAGHETRYDVRYHTMRYPGEIAQDALHTSETQRLRYLARKFMSDLARGQHLFAVKRKEPLHAEEVALLLSAIRQKGPTCLLWVAEADRDHVAGSAEFIMPGLLRGYVRRIDVSPLKKIDMQSWAEMAHNACAVWRSVAANAGEPPSNLPKPNLATASLLKEADAAAHA